MRLERGHGILRLPPRAREVHVVREILRVAREQPHRTVGVHQPTPETLGIANLAFERPAVAAPVDEQRWIVLPGRRHDLETNPQQYVLAPTRELARLHRRATDQVD